MAAPDTNRHQRGIALVLSLFILIALLLVGVSAAQMALQGEKVARGERSRHIAFHAAEEALMDAENDIEGSPDMPGRSALFAPDSALGFTEGCGPAAAGEDFGLCLRAPDGAPPVWQSVDFSDDNPVTARAVPYGHFTGAAMQTGQGFLPFKRPRYIIELVSYRREGEDAGAGQQYFYRVTAVGFGTQEDSQVVLQSFYRKPPGGAAP